jgi:hypothetical protein
MEIRISHKSEDMLIATCMTIDSQLLRFDVYDPTIQRSLQGIMLEIRSPARHQLNMISMFQQYFNNAWNRAEPVRRSGRIVWAFERQWQLGAFALFTVLTIVEFPNVWSAIFSGVSATFLFNSLAPVSQRFRSFVGKHLK